MQNTKISKIGTTNIQKKRIQYHTLKILLNGFFLAEYKLTNTHNFCIFIKNFRNGRIKKYSISYFSGN